MCTSYVCHIGQIVAFQVEVVAVVNFCRAMLCIGTAYAVMRCLSVCPSVTFVDNVKTNKHIFEIFFTFS